MRLAFVHGINNENNSPQDIEDVWWDAIQQGWSDAGLSPKTKPAIDVGYYADILANATAGVESTAIAQGASTKTGSPAQEFLDAYKDAAGITNSEVQAALNQQGKPVSETVAQGLFQGVLVDAAGAIESILPLRGRLIASKFLTQATHYIQNQGLAAQIGVTVRRAIFDNHQEPVLLVSHSLGTVVSYKLLAEDRLSDRRVPLFITLGSPLGIGMMKKILPPRATIPNPPIMDWVNGYRYDDFVTLDRELNNSTIGFNGVTNIRENLVEEDDKHSITAYLKSTPICSRIHAALP